MRVHTHTRTCTHTHTEGFTSKSLGPWDILMGKIPAPGILQTLSHGSYPSRRTLHPSDNHDYLTKPDRHHPPKQPNSVGARNTSAKSFKRQESQGAGRGQQGEMGLGKKSVWIKAATGEWPWLWPSPALGWGAVKRVARKAEGRYATHSEDNPPRA